MKTNSLALNILNKKFEVSCPITEQERLAAAGHYLDAKMQEISDKGTILGYERIAIVAALNIAYDFLKAEEDKHSLTHGLNEHLEGLKARIERVLEINPTELNIEKY